MDDGGRQQKFWQVSSYGIPMIYVVQPRNLCNVVANIGPNRQVCCPLVVVSLFSLLKGYVPIGQKDFDLSTADGAVAFLRETYNLIARIK